MKKIKIKTSIISSETKKEEEVQAIYEETKKYIYYVEQDEKKTATIYHLQENTLERDNEEIYLKLQFKEKEKTTGILELKDLGRKTELEIYTSKIKKRKTTTEITYISNEEEYTYKIEYIEKYN